jgi:hypothetical protein
MNVVFGLIFGIVFASGGVFVALETTVPTYQSWQIMKSWQSTPTTLIKVSASDNNIEATYRYTVSGVEYSNDRVYLTSVKDNIGSYHQDMYLQLQWLKNNYQSITIWYNPNSPDYSVIDREVRWGLFALMTGFCSIFILIGLGVSNAGLKTSKQQQGKYNRPTLFELRKQWKQHQADNNFAEGFIEYSQQRFHELDKQTDVEQSNHTTTGSQPWQAKLTIIYMKDNQMKYLHTL